MDNIQVFTNQLFGSVRSVEINGEPWFVGSDVASCLGYNNTWDALAKHVDIEDKNSIAIREGIPGNPNMTIINESGLYSLIFSSKLPAAKAFKRWVTSEVLPTMRKLGFDQSLSILQEELNKKEELIRYLQTQNSRVGELSMSNAVNDAEKKYLECWAIMSPYIPEEHRKDAFIFDPTDSDPYLDMDYIINDFKLKNNIF